MTTDIPKGHCDLYEASTVKAISPDARCVVCGESFTVGTVCVMGDELWHHSCPTAVEGKGES